MKKVYEKPEIKVYLYKAEKILTESSVEKATAALGTTLNTTAPAASFTDTMVVSW